MNPILLARAVPRTFCDSLTAPGGPLRADAPAAQRLPPAAPQAFLHRATESMPLARPAASHDSRVVSSLAPSPCFPLPPGAAHSCPPGFQAPTIRIPIRSAHSCRYEITRLIKCLVSDLTSRY